MRPRRNTKGGKRKKKKEKSRNENTLQVVKPNRPGKLSTLKAFHLQTEKGGRACRKPIIYIREIPRSPGVCTVSKSTESRNTVVEASGGKCISCERNENDRDNRQRTTDRDNN